MLPQFEHESRERMGKVHAGLGNRYQSTFGQLTAGQQALTEARNRALLERDIYDSGQDRYAKMLENTTKLGEMFKSAQESRQRPYLSLAELLKYPGANTSSYNQTLVDRYGRRIQGTQNVQTSTPTPQKPFWQELALGIASNPSTFGAIG